MSPAALEIGGLAVQYGSTPVLRGAGLRIEAGTIVGLVGDSGSGKSTLALAALGLTRPGGRITGGEVWVEGEDLLAATPERRRQLRGGRIALIPQSARASLHPMVTVGEQLARVAATRQRSRRAQAAAAVDALRRVGIADPARRARSFPHELSGGMAQRVLIAMALIADPVVLLADEPTSGLDVTIQAQVLDDLAGLADQAGLALLLISHSRAIADNYCDRTLRLEAGRIVEPHAVSVPELAGGGR